jgi:hypothetical protein
MLHRIAHRKWRFPVGAIDGRRARIDEMLQARQGARQFQHHRLAHHIGGDIGEGVFQAVAHAGLCRQMHDCGDITGRQRQYRILVGDIGLMKRESLFGCKPGKPRFFQADIVIGVEIVDAQDAVAARQKGLAYGGTDEAGCARDQYIRQNRPPGKMPVANIAKDTPAVNRRFGRLT